MPSGTRDTPLSTQPRRPHRRGGHFTSGPAPRGEAHRPPGPGRRHFRAAGGGGRSWVAPGQATAMAATAAAALPAAAARLGRAVAAAPEARLESVRALAGLFREEQPRLAGRRDRPRPRGPGEGAPVSGKRRAGAGLGSARLCSECRRGPRGGRLRAPLRKGPAEQRRGAAVFLP